MEAITSATLETFLQRLGERSPSAGVLYLLHDRLIEFGELESHFNAVLPDAP